MAHRRSDLVQAAPQDFLAHPGNWMEWISTYRGTATAGPNFAWVLAARALRRLPGLDLSSLRIALNGAEPVDPDAVEAFVAAAAPFGFRPGAVFSAFGMAEVAIAGTFPEPLRGMRLRRRRPRGAGAGAGRQARRDRDPDDEALHPPPAAARQAGAWPGAPHRRARDRARTCPSARSASCSSGAPR